MPNRIAQILHATRNTLVADTAGVLAIGLMTMGILHLPGLI
jgi:hypothetical protein